MGRQAKATCFRFMICRNNFAEKDGHTVPKVVKKSEKKRRQISSKTSFQELCNIVISETRTPDYNNAVQENINSLVLEHTDELNQLEVNSDRHSLKHLTVVNQLPSAGDCDTYTVKDSLVVDHLTISNYDNCEAHSGKDSVVEVPVGNIGNCFEVEDSLTEHKLEAVGNSGSFSVTDSFGQLAGVGKCDTGLVTNFLLEENCIEPTNAVESQAVETCIPYDGEITTASDQNVKDYAPIFIQAAVKRFLAEKDICKNNAVESQAGENFPPTRGIHKIKTMFTTRHAHQTIKEGSEQEKLSNKLQVTGKVLGSMSNIKPMKVSHDLAKTDSAWRWLEERITHPTQPDKRQEQEITQIRIKQENNEQKNLDSHDTEDATFTGDASFTFQPIQYSHSTKPTEYGIKNLTDSSRMRLHFPVTIADIDVDTLESDNHKLFQHGQEALSKNDYGFLDTTKMLVESESTEHEIHDIETQLSKHTTVRTFCVNSETKNNPFSVSSRDASSSEIAAIETNIGKLPVQCVNESTSYADQVSEGGSGSFQFHFSSSENIAEPGLRYNPFSYNPYFGNPYLDCSGSVSPPMPHLKAEALDDFVKIPENDTKKGECIDNGNSGADIESEMRDVNSPVQNSCSHLIVKLEQCNELISLIDSLHVEQHLEESATSNVYIKLENSKPSDICSSTASSPRSHDVVPDSQRTPSTQISVTAKLSKAEHNIYTPKSRTQSSHRCCQSIFKNDPGGIVSEHFPKDIKSSNRQKFIGISGPDQVDSNYNSIPSYMQTTESLRAKFSVDLKSTSDAHDNSVKKRPSLHTEHGKLNLSTGLQRSLQ